MARIGHLVAALSLLFVRPLLPFVLAFLALAKVTGSGSRYGPNYRPDRT